MTRRLLLSFAAMIGVAACMDTAVIEPVESSTTQEIGLPPSCPPGQTVVFWEEATGFCGSCGTSRDPGSTARQYAACSGNIQGTKRLIQANLCVRPCELL